MKRQRASPASLSRTRSFLRRSVLLRPSKIPSGLAPGEDHWHGAAPDRFMVHIALNEVDEEHPDAHWCDKVTDAEYATQANPRSRRSA